MGKSCKELAKSLLECMKETQCVKDGGEVRVCMKTVSDCQSLRNTYTLCRKEALDMRSRIRGNKHY